MEMGSSLVAVIPQSLYWLCSISMPPWSLKKEWQKVYLENGDKSKEQRNSNGVSSKSPQDDVLKESTGKKIMFNRIATIWGRLEALGESANLAHGLDRVTQLISTARMEKIEEMIVVEVGNEDFQVRVSETLAPEIE
ncbi:hypothetical protein V6N11_013790 [Hibiscus sabdariffa]|uniref:Uncharacterized protein n=1 Tax=Hibiscus sabdariffa TaxID=183260 RepID=A0ABR2PDH6_9ROSI